MQLLQRLPLFLHPFLPSSLSPSFSSSSSSSVSFSSRFDDHDGRREVIDSRRSRWVGLVLLLLLLCLCCCLSTSTTTTSSTSSSSAPFTTAAGLVVLVPRHVCVGTREGGSQVEERIAGLLL
jgi:hypothetical protein